MLRPKKVISAFFLFVVIGLHLPAAKAQQYLTVGDGHVEADVNRSDGWGLLDLYYFDGTGTRQRLTFANFSYLTVQVNGVFYTNDSYLSSGMDWETGQNVNVQYLNNASNVKIKDTIESVWAIGTNGFDIVQDVYPVTSTLNPSGVIVYRFSIRNHQPSFLAAQAQYLLDVETSDASGANDDPKITSREGYNETSGLDFWHNFKTLPPYFITSENDICTKTFPGQLGIGYTVDSLAPDSMGLIRPSLMANVDFKQYSALGSPSTVWGFPSSFEGNPMSADNAMLFQWPQSGVGAAPQGGTSMQVIGMGCYGVPPCAALPSDLCYGNLDVTLLHNEHIKWQGQYVPNHFPVEAVIWNSNQSSDGAAVTGNQTISNTSGSGLPGPVQIVSPTPVLNNGYSQTHAITSGGAPKPDSMVLQCSSAFISWEDTLIQDKYLVNCSTDSVYDITFSFASGKGFGGGLGFLSGACSCPIEVDCQEKDITPPFHSKHVGSRVDSCGNYLVFTDSVFDNRPTDLGIQSITYTEVPPGSVKITGIPTPITGCPSFVGPITMLQTDTLLTAAVYFTFTDCAGNVSYDTVFYGKCIPSAPIDTLPPHFRPLSKYDWVDTNTTCGFRCSAWVVTDTVKNGLQQDKGLLSITVVSSNNMTFTPGPPVTKGMPKDSFTVCVNDTMQDGDIIIEAQDASTPPNISYDTITFCTVPDTAKPHISIGTLLPGLQYNVTSWDDSAWDRGLKQVILTKTPFNPFNCKPIANGSITLDSVNDTTWIVTPTAGVSCPATMSFYVAVVDSFNNACFSVQATDCAGNVSAKKTQCYTALSDTYCPRIDTVTLPNGALSVTVYDIHTGGPDTIGYDEGIDSVWFTCAHNMSMVVDSGTTDANGSIFQSQGNSLHTLHGTPTGGDHPKYAKVVRFTLFVTDTNSQDGIQPCVCINALDGAKNGLSGSSGCGETYTWCSSVAQDRFPPELSLASNCETIGVVVTDSTQYDRGVDRVWLDSITNFVAINDSSFSGQKVVPLTLRVPDSNKSSYGVLSSVDVFGIGSPVPGVAAQHTTTSDVWIYKQDLRMYGTGIADANTNFSIPVMLVPTDSVPLVQKNLTQFAFTFHLSGSALVNYTGFTLSQALKNAGWTSGPASAVPPYVISANGPKLTNAESTDTLVILHFSALASNDVEEAQVQIDPDPCGAGVVYNGGNDTVLSGTSFTASLPAPSGRLNGGTIILKDSCGTIVGINPHPVYLSIAPVVPNPVANFAVVSYTVPTEAPVSLELYDELGRKVRTLVTETEKQGTYQIEIQTGGLAAGMYHLLLTSRGEQASQWVMIP